MVDSFVSIRREGFIPPANWYHTLIAKLLNDGDLEGKWLWLWLCWPKLMDIRYPVFGPRDERTQLFPLPRFLLCTYHPLHVEAGYQGLGRAVGANVG